MDLVSSSGLNLSNHRFDRVEAAKYCGISVVTIDRALSKAKIACYRIGRRVVFSKQHLDEFLSRYEVKAKDFFKKGAR